MKLNQIRDVVAIADRWSLRAAAQHADRLLECSREIAARKSGYVRERLQFNMFLNREIMPTLAESRKTVPK
jgi:hypothetical protein